MFVMRVGTPIALRECVQKIEFSINPSPHDLAYPFGDDMKSFTQAQADTLPALLPLSPTPSEA